LAFVDRQALALLVEPIKHDLHITDVQIGLLYGIGFTLVYVIVSLPVARLADRAKRRDIVAAAVLVWSLMTVVCGVARSFGALAAARIGVGAGEGGLNPAAHSMLADSFSPPRLASAMGVYALGNYLGNALALVIGALVVGALAHHAPLRLPFIGVTAGWQVVFLVVGAPGLILSLALRLLPEPARTVGVLGASAPVIPLREVVRYAARHWTAYFGIALGFTLTVFVGVAGAAWIPSFLIRTYGWTPSRVGLVYGPVVLAAGVLGSLAGGLIASAARRRQSRFGNLLVPLVASLALIPLSILYPLAPNALIALTTMGVLIFIGAMTNGGAFAALQEITPGRMRSVTTAAFFICVNLLGASLGPLAVALLTERVFHNPHELPLALSLCACVGSPLAFAALLLGAKGYAGAAAEAARG
jgi:MFS family permease